MSLIIAIFSLIFLTSFCLILFLFIVVRRVIVQGYEEKFERKYKQIENDILEAIESEESELAVQAALKSRTYPKVLTQVLIDYYEAIKGHGRDQLKIIFDHALKTKVIKDLDSRRISKRLSAIRLFVIFSDSSGSQQILKLLNDKPMARLTAISALSCIPTAETLSYIFDAFEKDSGQNTKMYINIMYSLGNKIEFFVKEYLRKDLFVEKKFLLIELVGSLLLSSLFSDIVAFADHPDKEIRIAVARALGKLLIPESYDILLKFSADKEWEVQAQAVKSLGKLKNLEALDTLSESLCSSNWHVRYNAGHSLAKLGAPGIRRLKKISKESIDRFASDMATMVLDNIIFTEEI